MPLNRRNTREHLRVLRAGSDLQRLALYKRGDDQRQGTVVALTLFGCWRNRIVRTGQTLRVRLSVDERCTWHIPRAELNRAGVDTILATDKLYDPVNGTGWWTPYASLTISEVLFGNVVDVDCKAADPLGPYG